jgi:hypothetical protein
MRLWWAGNMARKGRPGMRIHNFCGKPLGPCSPTKPSRRWEDIINMNLRENRLWGWTELANDRVLWQAVVSRGVELPDFALTVSEGRHYEMDIPHRQNAKRETPQINVVLKQETRPPVVKTVRQLRQVTKQSHSLTVWSHINVSSHLTAINLL